MAFFKISFSDPNFDKYEVSVPGNKKIILKLEKEEYLESELLASFFDAILARATISGQDQNGIYKRILFNTVRSVFIKPNRVVRALIFNGK